MKQNRRKYNPDFKALVAMEALKGKETITESAIRVRYIRLKSINRRKNWLTAAVHHSRWYVREHYLISAAPNCIINR